VKQKHSWDFCDEFLLWGFGILECPKSFGQICKGKLVPNQEFCISSKKFQNVNIKNKLAFFIWRCEVNVMAQNKVGSQISSLTLNH
jgi:hypothetical protein